MASCEATGPPGRNCVTPARVRAVGTPALRFCTTPPSTRISAPTNEIGSSTRVTARVRSTQKLPSRSVVVRAKPRTSAIATAMPTAADRKFCTASPAICTRWPIVDSPL